MALDTRIPLQARGVDVGGVMRNALATMGGLQKFQANVEAMRTRGNVRNAFALMQEDPEAGFAALNRASPEAAFQFQERKAKVAEINERTEASKLNRAMGQNRRVLKVAEQALRVHRTTKVPLDPDAAMNAFLRDQGPELVDLFGKDAAEELLSQNITLEDAQAFYNDRSMQQEQLEAQAGVKKGAGKAPKRETREIIDDAGKRVEVTEEFRNGAWAEVSRVPVEKEEEAEPLSKAGRIAWDVKKGFIEKNAEVIKGDPPEHYQWDGDRLKPIPGGKADPKNPMTTKELASLANAYGDDYAKASQEFTKVRDSYGRIKAIKNTAAGDLALIFNYMKMLDPGSVVRESEFAQAAATGAWGERLKAAGERILKGTRLSDVMRADFLETANGLYGPALKSQQERAGQFRKIAERAKLDPQDILDRVVMSGVEVPPTGVVEPAPGVVTPPAADVSDEDLNKMSDEELLEFLLKEG